MKSSSSLRQLFTPQFTNLVNQNLYSKMETRKSKIHRIFFDIDETLFSRYLGFSNNVEPEVAYYSNKGSGKPYFWINKEAWSIVFPELLNSNYEVAFMTASTQHTEAQIKQTLNDAFAKNTLFNFSHCQFYQGHELGTPATPKGHKLSQLFINNDEREKTLLIDDHHDHVSTAAACGFKCIKAGSGQYFHDLATLLNLNIKLPKYTSYQLGSDQYRENIEIKKLSIVDDYSGMPSSYRCEDSKAQRCRSNISS